MPTSQNHLLVINPSDVVLRLIKAGVETKTEDTFNVTVVVTTDLDCTIPGTYYAAFNVTDAAGNMAASLFMIGG